MGEALDERRLLDLVGKDPFVRRLVVLESTSSTNDDLRRLAAEGAPEGTVVIADHQTAGRGRLGRRWHTSKGAGVCVSMLFRPNAPVEEIPRFTLGAAVAACRACRDAGVAAEIRWPNDIFVDGRKVAGILAEVRSTGALAGELVVGAGFNVNDDGGSFPEEIRRTAGSLRMAVGAPVDREELAARFVLGLGEIGRSLSSGGWERVSADWSTLSPRSRGSRVRVHAEDRETFCGVTRGIDPSGALEVVREDGSVALVRLGESVTFPEE